MEKPLRLLLALLLVSSGSIHAADQMPREHPLNRMKQSRIVQNELDSLNAFLAELTGGKRNRHAFIYLQQRIHDIPAAYRAPVLEAVIDQLSLSEGADIVATIRFQLARIYREQNSAEDAIRCLEDGIDIAENEDLLRELLRSLVRHLHLYGRLEEAVTTNEQLIAFTKKNKAPIDHVRALTEQGTLLNKLGRHGEVRELLRTLARKINAIQDYPSDQGRILKLNGSHWSETGHFREAIRYTNLAISAFDEADDFHEIANCHYNLAIYHKQSGNFEKAAKYYRHAASQFESLGSLGGAGMAQSAHGRLAFEQADYEKSLQLLDKAVYNLEVDGSRRRLATALERLATTLEALGRSGQAHSARTRAKAIRLEL